MKAGPAVALPSQFENEDRRGARRQRWRLSRILSYWCGYLSILGAVIASPLIVTSPRSSWPVVLGWVAVAGAGIAWGAYSTGRRDSLVLQLSGAEGLRAFARESSWELFEKVPSDEKGWSIGPLSQTRRGAVRPVAWSATYEWIAFVEAGEVAADAWPEGAAIAWCKLDAPLPMMAFIPTGIDPALLGIEGGQTGEVDVSSFSLMIPWRVFSADADLTRAAMTPAVVEALNTASPFPMAFFLEGSSALAVSDASDVRADFVSMSDVLTDFVLELDPKTLVEGARPERAAADLAADFAEASVGALKASSRVYMRLWLLWLVSVVAGSSAVIAMILRRSLAPTPEAREPFLGPAGIYGWIFGVSVALSVIAMLVMTRVERARKGLALQVVQVARARDWTIAAHTPDMEQGWTRRPFARVRRLRWGPVARGDSGGTNAGVAFVEGDIGVGAWAPRMFVSRVAWADVGVELPQMDFLREGFSTRLAKWCGGRDLDVESYAFNTKWRIRTDDARAAHALLQPTMIVLLTEIADEGVAYHLDGTRVVLWDDGRNGGIDLARRVELVERFVAALPSFLRKPVA